eukprot:CAMPEP_0181102252 /NCGR_PEP_ID=MMETSP1071-20121207/14214_1 /TAXON_ID=35127 /ORGANISM="Thalassiosira sp., Strain NH16" /LENGTH=76 /DNA_ID=CAMNT_0023185209 /DNA_START=683 /DNA_END=913 /DNA_ORIENTATION=+
MIVCLGKAAGFSIVLRGPEVAVSGLIWLRISWTDIGRPKPSSSSDDDSSSSSDSSLSSGESRRWALVMARSNIFGD